MPTTNQFRAEWHVGKNQGFVEIRINPQNKFRVDFSDAAEFGAIVGLLATAENARLSSGLFEIAWTDIDGD